MKEKLIRFMQGRYGIDQLSKLLIVLGVVAVLVSAFVNWGVLGLIIYFLGWVLVIWDISECFPEMSQNVTRRMKRFWRKPAGSGIFFRNRSICGSREKHIIFISARDAGRKSGFLKERGGLRCAARSVVQHLLRKADDRTERKNFRYPF